jgi:hypothetical protein
MERPSLPVSSASPLLQGTTRRAFLRLLGSGAALATLSRLPAVPATARAATPATRFFDEPQTEILTQVVERMVATGEPEAPRVRDSGAIASIDALCGSLAPELTGPLPALLRLVEWGPVLFELRFSRFTRLTPDEQDASLRGWMQSRIALRRTAFLALRNLAMLGWYAQDESWPSVGYSGPLLRRSPAP